MEQIYTIPVNEAFEASAADAGCGCPLCTLYTRLQENELELILGASMMEPDVRQKTNLQGFCRRHYGMMFQRKNRLGLGLMLSAGEVPRIAGTFGLDTTTRANLMSAVYTAQAAVNTTRTVVQAVAPK